MILAKQKGKQAFDWVCDKFGIPQSSDTQRVARQMGFQKVAVEKVHLLFCEEAAIQQI